MGVSVKLKSLRVKICGITELEAGQAIAALGASDLGFICVAASPRYVPLPNLANLVPPLQAIVNCVGVFADADLAEVVAVATTAQFGSIQLHGRESIEYCQALRELLPDREIIKAWRIKDSTDLERILTYTNVVDALLLDAYHPQALGGTGQTLNWLELQNWRSPIPWLLAGGLNPDNILVALDQLQPTGIDLSSGLEISPGHKDLAKVQRLFDQLKLRH
jgi:phosphoribosylanthranilate isomerase